jgi:hypothetical protein
MPMPPLRPAHAKSPGTNLIRELAEGGKVANGAHNHARELGVHGNIGVLLSVPPQQVKLCLQVRGPHLTDHTTNTALLFTHKKIRNTLGWGHSRGGVGV